ncbi:response regulator [Dongia soli]|uniref:histidine kinase n=1 Tax=Dongia soli TaxID=600628 RepID=A0ABU5EEI4_9PROT|nr:response regulator [Dongia soli]MDY0884621.1 response regulator [Dongia soli]
MNNSGVTILNVDDTEALRYAKSRILNRAGYAVREASTGHDALREVETSQPALVLLDVKLPDISGTEVCRLIKQRYPSVLILQTSATYVTGADRVAGLDSGADAYLIQPVEPEELVAAVRALLRLQAAEEALRQANEGLEQRVAERTRELEEANRRLRHEAEERARAEAALRQSQKMEALGQLTGGIAHDFNNLLGAISGSLQLMQRRIKSGRVDVERYIEAALFGTNRAAKLTSRLLAFSRQQPLNLRSVNVNDLARGMLDMLRRTMGEQIKVELDLQAEPAWTRCDENQLENALLNLAINARDAMPSGGHFRIETRNETLQNGLRDELVNLAPGNYVTLAVVDTGSGMTAEVKKRAMEPFFTTKPIGQGTGLGLSMIYGLMTQSGGALVLESEVNRGTSVKLYLKREEPASAMARHAPDGETEMPKIEATILVVEDEELLRSMMIEVLQEENYQTLAAHDGPSALEQLNGDAPIDLLVTDVGLPGINGRQLVERARTIKPDLKILFVTGYSRDLLRRQMAEPGEDESAHWIKGIEILRKPFELTDFSQTVRGILTGE